MKNPEEIRNKSGVYIITNLKKDSRNQYIGIANNILRRWNEHKDKAKHPKRKDDQEKVLYKAMRKYGIENFSIEVLEEIDKNDIEKMKEREIYWIGKLNTYYKGYNETKGGDYIGEKQKHYGEDHPNHIFTLKEVEQCRDWYKEGRTRKEIYDKYFSDRDCWSAFSNMWFGRSWKWVKPEVFEKKQNPRQKVTEEMIKDIRYKYEVENMKIYHISKLYKGILGYGTVWDIANHKRF